MKKRFRAVSVLILISCLLAWSAYAAALPPVLAQFHARVEHARANLPAITAAAEAAAARSLADPAALITANYGKQASFAEEMMNRSGCLANCLDEWARRKIATPHDIFLFSVRAWETDGLKSLDELVQAKKNGWLVVLFASKAGMPPQGNDLKIDFILDNGARTGGEGEAAVNVIANVMNGWLWTCEYTAAMTRHGKRPGILQSILTPGWETNNNPITSETTRNTQFDCATPIAAGELAKAYLERVDQLIADLAAAPSQRQIERAATLMAEQIRRGGRVGVTHAVHILTNELDKDLPAALPASQIHAFNVIWTANKSFADHVKPDDLVVFFSFVGLNTPLEDYATPLRATKARFITCHLADTHATNNAPDAAAHIDACWAHPDAVVPVPFAPGKMATVAGLNHALAYRMLLDAAAEMANDSSGKTTSRH